MHLPLHCTGEGISLLYHPTTNLDTSRNRNRNETPVSPRIGNHRLPTGKWKARSLHCNARRRVRYEEDYENEDEDEEYGYNEEIAMLEVYSQSARGEALLVKATVDGREEQVLVFKGFSSSLSYGTATDLSKSVLPARAVIKSIDRVKGPFDPSNIEYIEPGLTWEAFKTRFTRQ